MASAIAGKKAMAMPTITAPIVSIGPDMFRLRNVINPQMAVPSF
jgi:hypothetical protein